MKRAMECSCGKKLIVVDAEKVFIFFCPSYDLIEVHDIVIVRKK